jgi:biopolymer transport protein ExbB
MMELFTNVGIFLYPLAACSLIAATITLERLWALRQSRVLPVHMLEAFVAGRVDALPADLQSVSGRIVTFYRERRPDAEALNAYARLEVSRMERGVFLLEFVIGAAPLLGLLGTVIGLTQVFGGFSADTGLPDTAVFIKGIALALNTTIVGLAIAIPALAAHAYLLRRVEALAAQLSVGLECLSEQTKQAEAATTETTA